MSYELRRAFEAFMEAMDKELSQKDDRISYLEDWNIRLNTENDKLKLNLKNAAGILASAAQALQEGLNDY